MRGVKSHEIIIKGVQVLLNLAHRGACGCDSETGDGAGILLQIPHTFFARECGKLGFELPRSGAYGVGMTFLMEEHAAPYLATGQLLRVLEDWCEPFPGYFLYYPSRRQQPAALSALIDALRL